MKAIQLTPQLYDYVVGHAQPLSPVLAALASETSRMPRANMQIAPEQGKLMHLLVKLIGAKRIIEVGCFTGYSAVSMASALPADGRLLTLDINPETAAVARRYFAAAGLGERVDLRLGPALASLAQIASEWGLASVDMMFIDADKVQMPAYFEWGYKLLRSGGLIIADNVLWDGKVVDPSDQSEDTVAIRAFNDQVLADQRFESVMLNVADGLYLCRKR